MLVGKTDNWQVIGQIIAASVARGVLGMEAPWAYRIPFAVQWVLRKTDDTIQYADN